MSITSARRPTGPAAAAPTSGLTAARLIVLGTITALGALSIDMYLPSFPDLARDMHASESAVQLTLTATVIGLAIGQLIAGPISDAVGRRRPIILGLGGWALISLACAFAPSIVTLTGLRFAQGLAGSAGLVVARAVVRDLAEGDQLARAFARLMLVVGVVPILAPTLGGLLLRTTGWRGLFIVLGSVGLVMTLVVSLVLQESLPAERRRTAGLPESLRSYRSLLRDRAFMGSALVVAFTFAALFSYVSASSFIFRDVFGLSPSAFGLVFGANSVALVCGTQLTGGLSGRVGQRRLLGIGLGVATLAAAVLLGDALLPGVGFFGVAGPLWLMVFGVGMAMPMASSQAMMLHPERAGAASALLGLFQFSVGGLLSPLVGAAGTSSVLPLGLLCVASLLVAVAIFTVTGRLRAVDGGQATERREEVPAGLSGAGAGH